MDSDDSNIGRGFRIGPYIVEPLLGSVDGPGGASHHLEPKVMEVLTVLSARPNTLVTREELLEAVWPRHVAADQLLTRAVSQLRRVFHDERGNPRYIETVPKRGYRLIADVFPLPDRSPDTVGPVRKRRGVTLATLLVLAVIAGVIATAHFTATGPDVSRQTKYLPTSIAILPFRNMTGDPEYDYLAEGLAEEIRNLLASIPGARFKVIGRRSSSSFREGQEDLRAIGEALGVGTLLDGSLRSTGERVRVNVQLIDTSEESQIWSETFEEPMQDIFALQDQIAQAVLDELQIRLATYPTRGRPTTSSEAYALYLKARLALDTQTTHPAEIHLRKAVELDPQFADAWELLAQTYWVWPVDERDYPANARGPDDIVVLMREAAGKALQVAPERRFARALYIEANAGNFSLADAIEAYIDAARQLPNDPTILRTLTWHLIMSGYLADGLQLAERMVEIDPLSSMAHTRRYVGLFAMGRHGEALQALQLARQLESDFRMDWYLGEHHLSVGNDEAAMNHFEAALLAYGVDNRSWIRRLIPAARDSAEGSAILDREIARITASLPAGQFDFVAEGMTRWHLFFGHLDRYFEVILSTSEEDLRFSSAEYFVWYGVVNRQTGFTAHPRYLEVAERMDLINVWERIGPPDYCEKQRAGWLCR